MRLTIPPRPVLMWFAGWGAQTTSSGDTYYVDHVTGRTGWERPAGYLSTGSGVGGAEAPLPPGAHAR